MSGQPSRRDFLWTAASSIVVIKTAGTPASLLVTEQAAAITAGELTDRIREHAGVPWRATTVDGFKSGGPDALVHGVATTVVATADVLRKAAAAGHNLIVTQEPTFYTAAEDGGAAANDPVQALKKSLIDDRHLIVWRFSDHWNARRPSEAVAALANALGWSANRQGDVEGLYKIPEIRLDALLEHVRTRLRLRGGLRWLGVSDMPVRTVLLSPGTTDLPSTVARMPRADAIIAGEPREWEAIPYVLDARPRKALIAVGRIASLEPSAAACATWLRSFTTGVPVEALAVGDPYWSPIA